MLRYILRRVLLFLPIMFGVTLLVFLIMHLTPGDPAELALGPLADKGEIEALREDLGLNKPLIVQYGIFLGRVAGGNLGRSIVTRQPVLQEYLARLPATCLLAGASMAFAILIGIPLGLLAAVKHNTPVDTAASTAALLGFSIPSFWLALMLMMVFSVQLKILPPSGYGSWQHLVLPTVSLGLHVVAVIARITRSSVLEVTRQDYIRTAWAKGVPAHAVFLHHLLRNALMPVVTVAGLYFGLLLGGVVVTETIFAYPGVGRLLIDAIRTHDYPVVQCGVLFFAFGVCSINLMVDISYAFLDPRIKARYRGEKG